MTELIKQKKQVPERLYSNKKLAALLIPLALDQLLNSFMGTIDTLVVSNLGSAAISAVSLVDAINILLINIFAALGTYFNCAGILCTCIWWNSSVFSLSWM